MSEMGHWNPRWNYHLGGEPRAVCRCSDGPYEGARPASWPRWCERCGGLVDNVALALQDALHAESLRRLQEWADEHAPDVSLREPEPTPDAHPASRESEQAAAGAGSL